MVRAQRNKATTGTSTRAERTQRAGDGASPAPTRARKITPEPPTETVRTDSESALAGSPEWQPAPE
jgi:hypothetical protein